MSVLMSLAAAASRLAAFRVLLAPLCMLCFLGCQNEPVLACDDPPVLNQAEVDFGRSSASSLYCPQLGLVVQELHAAPIVSERIVVQQYAAPLVVQRHVVTEAAPIIVQRQVVQKQVVAHSAPIVVQRQVVHEVAPAVLQRQVVKQQIAARPQIVKQRSKTVIRR